MPCFTWVRPFIPFVTMSIGLQEIEILSFALHINDKLPNSGAETEGITYEKQALAAYLE